MSCDLLANEKCNNFLESVFGPNERIVIPERFGWYLRVSRLSMEFSQKVSSRIKWIILSHVFGSPTLPIKQFVLKMRSTIFYHFFNFCYDSTLNITNKNTTKKNIGEMSPQPRPPLGVTCKPSDKWRVFWDPNDTWPSRWVAWRENDMWHPRPSCSPRRCWENGTRSVNKRCSVFFSFLGGFVFKGTLLNCSKDAWLNKTYEKKQIIKCDIGSKSTCEKIKGQE